MQISEIIKLIPHRFPFLLIDDVIDCTLGKSIKAIKNVSANEVFINGHFPGNPVMPNVLIIEGMAQSLAILVSKTMRDQKNVDSYEGIFLFAGIDNATFMKPVLPGDQLVFETILRKSRNNIWKCSSTASVKNKIVCSADLIAAYKN